MNSSKVEFKWYSRTGPVLLVAFKDKKICFAVFCHRRRDRSFEIFGHVFPLCARCTGISVGIVMVYLLSLLNVVVPPFLAFIFLLPLLLDGFSQVFSLRKSNNTLRLLTGIFFSVGILSLILGAR